MLSFSKELKLCGSEEFDFLSLSLSYLFILVS